MKFLETIAEQWSKFVAAAQPVMEKVAAAFAEVRKALRIVWRYIVRFRKGILSIPVALGAIYLAIYNMRELPELVGLDLQTDGTFSLQLDRFSAVMGPLAITALCLALMFCSKRTLTPWLVSAFSLALPVLILVINVFPA